jgi:hypothetical protein
VPHRRVKMEASVAVTDALDRVEGSLRKEGHNARRRSTGPSGAGPMTGRRVGYCAGFEAPGSVYG